MVHATEVVESLAAPPLTQSVLDLSGAASTCFQLRVASFKMLLEVSLVMAVEKSAGSAE